MKKLKLKISLFILDVRLAIEGLKAMIDSHRRNKLERKYKEG